MITEEQLVDVARIFDECSADLNEDIISESRSIPLHEVLLDIDKRHGRLAEYLASLGQNPRTQIIGLVNSAAPKLLSHS